MPATARRSSTPTPRRSAATESYTAATVYLDVTTYAPELAGTPRRS